MSNLMTIKIEFDGGNSQNNPKKGYGVGYGSYRLSGERYAYPVVRVNHGRPMSNNAAEIFTLIEAVKAAKQSAEEGFFCAHETRLHIVGDSQIALKWARRGGPAKHLSRNTSELFQQAIKELDEALAPFGEIHCEWKGRAHAVALFGH